MPSLHCTTPQPPPRPRRLPLPYRARHDPTAPAGTVRPARQPAEAARGRACVLVADDEPANQIIAAALLAGWGILPLLAADGSEAVEIVRVLSVDLVLMDLHMPVLDGWAATREIRRHEREHALARVPVVAYTSSGSAVVAAKLHDSGLDDLLAKPCEPRALHQCLLRWRVPGVSPFADAASART